jgi:hypothetical protein
VRSRGSHISRRNDVRPVQYRVIRRYETESPRVKALTIKQPWAWAIIHAGKDMENRSWLTRYRGELAIHAGARMHDYTKMPRGVRAPEDDELVFSAIIGIVEVVDSVEKSRSKWFMGPCGLVFRNARSLEKPVPCTGKLGLWNVPPEIERRLRRRLR